MPYEVVIYMLSCGDLRKRLQFQIIFQCAPFLKGLKVACIMNLRGAACEELDSFFEGTEVYYRVLTRQKGRCLVLFYREREFESFLGREDVQEFLKVYGYSGTDIQAVLGRLSRRVCQYAEHNSGFPHEIGVFLDYPVEDVACFIRERGRNSLLDGYWKVYHNPVRAQMTFYAYDKAKVSAVNEYLSGRSVRDIILRAR